MLTRATLPLLVRIGRAELVQFLISAGYLLFTGAAVWALADAPKSRYMPIVAALLTLLGAALAWWLSHRRAHLISDTPTSLIRSASQGYVELVGRATLLPGQRPLAFNGLPPCVWFEVIVREPNSLSTAGSQVWVKTSDELFALADESGTCVIDPDHCEVHGAHERRWRMEGTRYRARYLTQDDTLYALGELRTQRGGDGGVDFRTDVAQQLRQWKSNNRSMLNRFDANRDGRIDDEEYQVAVGEAERLVTAQRQEIRAYEDINLLRKPVTSYPYILSNSDPENVARRMRRWAAFHAVIAVLAGAGLAYLFAVG